MVLLLSGDSLVDGVFPCLSRHDLDAASMVCRQFRRSTAEKLATVCLRKLVCASLSCDDDDDDEFDESDSESSGSSDSESEDSPDSELGDSDAGTNDDVPKKWYAVNVRYLTPSQRVSIRKDFAQRMDAVKYFVDIIRSAFIRNLSITFDIFDNEICQLFPSVFKTMHIRKARFEFLSSSVCVVPFLSALGNVRDLTLEVPRKQALSGGSLLTFLGQLPRTPVTLGTTSDDGMRWEDDDAIIAFLFPPCGGERNCSSRHAVSSAFLGKLLRAVANSSSIHFPALNDYLREQAMPGDVPRLRTKIAPDGTQIWWLPSPDGHKALTVNFRQKDDRAYLDMQHR